MLLVASSALLGVYLTEVQVPQKLAQALTSVTSNPYLVLALLNVFLLFIGMFLHSAAAIILVVPIVMPLVQAVGIDPVHFGIIVTVNLSIGMFTPPFGLNLFVSQSLFQAPLGRIVRGVMPFLAIQLAALLVITYVPWLSLFLVQFVQ